MVFRRIDLVTIAVAHLEAARRDWTDRLGWEPSATSSRSATFPLDDCSIELVAAGEDAPGVTSVAVIVDDIEAATDRLAATGVAFTLTSDGTARLDPAALNGVPLQLRPAGAAGVGAGQVGRGAGRPYRRINHIVVAVSDDEAARSSWAGLFGDWTELPGHVVEAVHHVPVGIAWFGLTGSGTDADVSARFVQRRGEGVYALALVVDDQPVTVAALEERGAQIIRQASSGQTFVHPKTSHGLLIDLVAERPPSARSGPD